MALAAARGVDLTSATGSVVNVSLPWVWSYFADQQSKLTRSFRPVDWPADDEGPGRDEKIWLRSLVAGLVR